MSRRALEIGLANWLATGRRRIGQISIESMSEGGFSLTHREDTAREDLAPYQETDDATLLARFDDNGNYRPLKTAPNLRHGWRLTLANQDALAVALDLFYPGRLASLLAWETATLTTTSWRDTLNRQTGMYRVAAKISDQDSDILIGNFCRSDGGCLRTILWSRDDKGAVASSRLPPCKFDPVHDQTGAGESVIPLLCQEACNLLVAEARKVCQTGPSLRSA